jgi:hypothetical protein
MVDHFQPGCHLAYTIQAQFPLFDQHHMLNQSDQGGRGIGAELKEIRLVVNLP